jgi:hypothetical protein
MNPTSAELLDHYGTSTAMFSSESAPKLVEHESDNIPRDLVEQKAAAFDLISEFVYASSAIQSDIAKVIRPAFPTSKTVAKVLNSNETLVSRAQGKQPHLLKVKTSEAKHQPKPHLLTTAQLQDANAVLNSLVPANSAHVRKTNFSLIGLYRKYVERLNSSYGVLNEDYFRRLVHELHIICNVEAFPCALCKLWNSTNFGSTLSAEIYAICQSHFRTMNLQTEAYYNFLDELSRGCFGERMFGTTYSGALIVFDFGQLDPSTQRHKDGVMHFWLSDSAGSIRSVPFHFIGGEASEQPASVPFAVECIKRAALEIEIKELKLLVFFTDAGPKEFSSDMISMIPLLETELEKKISWNYFASNHGAGVSDSDQQNARSSLQSALPERKVINNTSTIIEILKSKQPGAKFVDATTFPRTISAPHLVGVSGISHYHCFNVENGAIMGYEDSWNLSNPKNFSIPSKSLSKQQQLLKARYDANLGVSYCQRCSVYYLEAHKCKRSAQFDVSAAESESHEKKLKLSDLDNEKSIEQEVPEEIETVDRVKEDALHELKKVDVYHENGLWFCGTIAKVCAKTCAVNFADGDKALRVKKRDLLTCIHDPQLTFGSMRGYPSYLFKKDL